MLLQEFLRAVKIRFALIDVKKAQKAAAGSKATKEKNTIANELKIITAPDEVYNVWADLIAANAQGELMDPESRKKFKELAKWKPENGIISKEFFKWLENTNYAQLKRLAEHLLNKPDEKRLYAYPKVTMKATKVAYPDCYSAFEWLERTKRKTIVKRQIHNLRPDYMLFSSSGDFMKSNWKKFKEDFAITSATLNVLLTAPGEEYFKEAKLSSSRNKAIADISPYAAEFFKVFLAHKGQFQIPKGSANFRAYNLENDKLSEWHDDAWNESSAKRIKDGINYGFPEPARSAGGRRVIHSGTVVLQRAPGYQVHKGPGGDRDSHMGLDLWIQGGPAENKSPPRRLRVRGELQSRVCGIHSGEVRAA